MKTLIPTTGSLNGQMDSYLPVQKFQLADGAAIRNASATIHETKGKLTSAFRKFFATGLKTKMFVMYLQAIEIFYIIYK